tara:strand:- start:25 stop:411 length:387 start_codon:yes stop_codon:yes gene_type:complete
LIETIESVMDIDDLFKVSREQRYIDSRMMLFKYLKDIDGYNCTEIARMSNMGASSVSNSIESFDVKIQYNQRLEDIWNFIRDENSDKLSSSNEDNLKAVDILDKLRDRSKVEMALSKFNMIITGINGL